MYHPTRRTVCAFAAANVVAFPVVARPIPAAPPPPSDPILPHYTTWCSARTRWDALAMLPENASLDTPDLLTLEASERRAFRAMAALTPVTAEGQAAILHVLHHHTDEPGLDAEADGGDERTLIASVWRSLTGRDGNPRKS